MRKILTILKYPLVLFIILLSAGCGLDDEYYLPQISSGNIRVQLNNNATIELPSISPITYSYFTNFAIYYKIYISDLRSDEQIAQDQTEQMSAINSTLTGDTNYLRGSTDPTVDTPSSTVLSNLNNRKYYALELEEENIISVLSSSSSGQMAIYFTADSIPTMDFKNNTYNLWRSTGSSGGVVFHPEPVDKRYFQNYPELNDSANVTPDKNADVANAATNIPASPRYTYVAMYILLKGFNPSNLNEIYGKPTFIGIFRLPEVI